MIVNQKVNTFLFGSKSEFDKLCYHIVTKIKEKKKEIVRVVYTCSSEKAIKEADKEKYENIFRYILKKEINIMTFDEEVEYKNKNDKKFECKLSFELELYHFSNEDGENDLDESVVLVITVENKYEYASGWSFGKYCSIDLDVPYEVYKYLYNLTLDDSEDNYTLTLCESGNDYTENKLSITIDNF